MKKIANLSKEQRKELFSETATLMNTTNAIVEKDFWVVWTLGNRFDFGLETGNKRRSITRATIKKQASEIQ